VTTTTAGAAGASLWDKVAIPESSGDWKNPNSGGHAGRPAGGLQIKTETWKAFGGEQFAPTADLATREQQIEVANRIAFTGFNGTKPQGLEAWEAITTGKVPGVTTSTPASAFGGGGAAPGVAAPSMSMGNVVPVWVVGMGPGGPGGGMTLGAFNPGAAAGILKDANGLQSGPASQAAAAAIASYFPQITEIGGARSSGVAGTHNAGKAIDIMIPNYETPQGIALGNQIRDFLQQNAQQLGVVYTIWQDQVQNTGLGGRSAGPGGTVGGHRNHIDVQFADGASVSIPAGVGQGLGGLALNQPAAPPPPGTPHAGTGALPGPATAPGLPGPNIATTGAAVPVMVMNWPGQSPTGEPPGLGAGIAAQLGQTGANAALQAGGQAAGAVSGDIISAVGGLGLEPWKTRKPDASVEQLIKEGNPLALAQMAGLHVQDFTREGGQAGETQGLGAPFDASGRLFSDTASLLDRTFTSLTAQIEAMKAQMLDVLNQIRQRVSEEVLKPIITTAVTEAFNGIKNSTMQNLGTPIGQAAGPPIADAVARAMPTNDSSGTGVGPAVTGLGGSVVSGLMDEGGLWPSGTVKANLSGSPERVLNPEQTRLFDAGLLGGWNRGSFATTSGIIGNDAVGAEFFGVSQVPIIGMIVNLLVRVLLSVIGVEIEVRDTLNELTDEFRTFRGDAFEAFDAQGRLLNDTSGLIDRSMSSEQTVADERIRILKIVLQALIKYIIEKVIVPIAKAVANAMIQAGSSAAGAAVNTQAPGAGGIVSALMSSAGQAGVDIAADVGSDFAISFSEVLIDMIGEGLQSMLPDLMTAMFSGGALEGIVGPFGNSTGGILGAVLGAGTGGIFGALSTLLLSLLGGAALGGFGGLGGGGLFDEGGIARGVGLMPKATLEPERVLSGRQTAAFERFVDALERGGVGGRTTHINAPFTVVGGPDAGKRAHTQLLELLS
jgi:hypothetical protein